jgi:DNA-binding GntR family transcriptional regulator
MAGLVQSRAEDAYQRIRALVNSGALAQGARVSEAELVRTLEMSRTPVREALLRLESEKVLHSTPGRGYVVAELTEQDLEHIYQVRAVLEGLAAEQAATRVTRTDLARLEDIYDLMQSALETSDDDALARANSQFHDTIASASGNTYLQTMLGNIRGTFETFRVTALAQPTRRDTAHSEHRELIEALRAKNAYLAQQIAHTHVLTALQVRRDALTRQSTTREHEGHETA